MNTSELKKKFNRCRDIIKTRVKKKIKKILLINPPQFQTSHLDIEMMDNKRYFNYPPYGLGLLSKALVKKNYKVEILDLNFEVLERFSNLVKADNTKNVKKENLQKIKENYLTKDYDGYSFNKDYEKILGTPIGELVLPILDDKLKKSKPDMVGISCMFTMTHKRMLGIAEKVKDYDEDICVFAGGVHPTSSAKMILLETKNIDFIAQFEADLTFPNFIDFVNGKNDEDTSLCQIATLDPDNNEYIETDRMLAPHGEDINIRPEYLDLKISDYSKYGEIGSYRFWWNKDTKASTILSNRGCRARCSFCSVRNFNGKGVRSRGFESVVDEMQYLNEKYGINHFMWLDDDLLFDKNRTLNIFNEIVKRNLKITWDASNGIIASALKDELLDAAADSGCIGLHFGIESGSDKILGEIHKPSGKKHYLALEDKLKKYPQIFTKGFLMAGFPGETLKQMKETIDMARQINLDWYTIQIVHPLPKTEMYDQMVSMGLLSHDEIQDEKLNYGNRSGKEKDREKKETKEAKKFLDPFILEDLNRIPSNEEMQDIWFIMDYKINYERLFEKIDISKKEKYLKFLKYISNKISTQNPLVELSVAHLESKNLKSNYTNIIDKKLEKSMYWKTRFENLNILSKI